MANNNYFFIFDDNGSTGWAQTPAPPDLGRPAQFVTYAEYSVAYIANTEAMYQTMLAGLEADVARNKTVRDAYVSVGIPAETAGLMSGYTGAVNARDEFINNHDGFVAVKPTAEEVGE